MFKKKDPLRKGFEILRDIRALKDRIIRIQSRIDDRTEELSKKLVDLQIKGEKYLAVRYAEEIARLKDLSNRLSVVLLVLDKMDIAVQHAIVKNELNMLASELKDIMKEVSRLPETRLPDLNIIFADLESDVRELSEITLTSSLTYNPPSDSDIKAILNEARETLKKSLEPAN
ncbi:MAG: hypothetical protein QXE81_04150 [Desulfurococcaceae archaeon]